MNIRTKIAIVTATALIGGFSLASASGHANIFQATDSATPVTQSQPDSASATAETTSPVDTTTTPSSDPTPATEPQNQPVEPAASKPTPKPATIYADKPSADTPCRLHDQNVYTNDCGTPAPQQQTVQAPAPADDPQPAPSDNSGTVVSNPNQP